MGHPSLVREQEPGTCPEAPFFPSRRQRSDFVWAVSPETVSVAKPDSMPPHVRA